MAEFPDNNYPFPVIKNYALAQDVNANLLEFCAGNKPKAGVLAVGVGNVMLL
jgi:hypothetical protein